MGTHEGGEADRLLQTAPPLRGSCTCWRDSSERREFRTFQAGGHSLARSQGREGKFLENQPTGKGTFPSDNPWTAGRVPPVGLMGSVAPGSPAPAPCTHILLGFWLPGNPCPGPGPFSLHPQPHPLAEQVPHGCVRLAGPSSSLGENRHGRGARVEKQQAGLPQAGSSLWVPPEPEPCSKGKKDTITQYHCRLFPNCGLFPTPRGPRSSRRPLSNPARQLPSSRDVPQPRGLHPTPRPKSYLPSPNCLPNPVKATARWARNTFSTLGDQT